MQSVMLAPLILICIVIGGHLSAPVLRRAEQSEAELELLFDPGLLKQHVSLTADYGEKPFLSLLSTENLYQPNLEDEYY